jgi:hypothetical protein
MLVEDLFDHLVGAGEHAVRHGQAERLGGLEVDHSGLLHREISWLGRRWRNALPRLRRRPGSPPSPAFLAVGGGGRDESGMLR